MIALNAHFDGKVLIPEQPFALPLNQKVRIELEPIEPSATNTPVVNPKPKRQLGLQRDLIVFMAEGWDAPLPDEFWEHNNSERGT